MTLVVMRSLRTMAETELKDLKLENEIIEKKIKIILTTKR